MAINKKVGIIAVCSVLLLVMVIGIVVTHVNNKNDDSTRKGNVAQSQKAVKSICKTTYYKETCEKSLNSNSNHTTDPKELIKVGFNVAVKHINDTISKSATLKEASTDPRTAGAYRVCEKMLDLAVDDLKRSFRKIDHFDFDIAKVDDYLFDLKVWLSGAHTAQGTCLDAFKNTSGDAGEKMKKLLKTSRELTMNGFAMINELSRVLQDLHITGSAQNRKLLSEGMEIPSDGQYPSWVKEHERHLLQGNNAISTPNVVVAQDGSGKYTSITEALKEVPRDNKTPFIIHIKAGVYKENVIIEKFMTNVVFVGDGPTKTKITGDRSDKKKFSTLESATVSALGFNFMAKDIGFENTAAADEGPAVALHVTSDQSIFHNCQMDGFQDTLFSHDHRQFYRDCKISGTIDFIFGDAISIFQNCQLIARKPAPKQANMVTAQGREFVDDITGIVIQNCNFLAEPDLLADPKIKTYLGRPWKKFSKTIIMHSNIGSFITPEGWDIWLPNSPNTDTSWIAEFENTGPGADTTNRVKWPSMKKMSSADAIAYTPSVFIRGDEWIIPTGVPYSGGLTSSNPNTNTNGVSSTNNTNALSSNSTSPTTSNTTSTTTSNGSANALTSNNSSANTVATNSSANATTSDSSANATASNGSANATTSNGSANALTSNSSASALTSDSSASALTSNNSANATTSDSSANTLTSSNTATAPTSSSTDTSTLSANNADATTTNSNGNSMQISNAADANTSPSTADTMTTPSTETGMTYDGTTATISASTTVTV